MERINLWCEVFGYATLGLVVGISVTMLVGGHRRRQAVRRTQEMLAARQAIAELYGPDCRCHYRMPGFVAPRIQDYDGYDDD